LAAQHRAATLIMFKPFSLLFFVLVFTWVVRIFLTTDGAERIERTCEPVEVFGKITVSGTALLADQFTTPVQATMNQWVYGCRYMVWRSVYEEEYLQWLMQNEAQDSAASITAPTPASHKDSSGKPDAAEPVRAKQKTEKL
jgi:signal transduction histidine kinase